MPEQTPPDPTDAPEPLEARTEAQVQAQVGEEVDAVLRGRLRRAPRYGRFIAAGVVIGLVVGLLAPFLGQGGWTGGIALFLGASGVLLGAVTGAAAAALLDLRSTR